MYDCSSVDVMPELKKNILNFGYGVLFGRKPKLLLDLEMDPDVRVSGTHREYLLQLRKRLEYLHKLLQEF